NNKPAAGWENSTADFWLWGGAHRVNTLMNQLDRLQPRSATVKTLERFNRIGGWTTDTPTGQAGSVFVSTDLDAMLDAVDLHADRRLHRVVKAMRRWNERQTDRDGDGFYDKPWGTVFNAWWSELSSSVFDEVAGFSNRFVLGNLVDRMLLGDDAGLPLGYDYLEGETVGAAVTSALIAALDGLAADYGSTNPRDWAQPIATIDWEPLPLTPGVGSTIWMNRGTYNQIVSLARWIRAQNVIAPGQSGDPTSPHFADQLALYAGWEYKPMRLTKRSLRGHVESIVRLRVP
ncbi:MAG: penicillin acylase family protein, partial [Acidimicrobiia bacterium]|nr:penicillin acylase family protein [Acidimicrobiia bacterium]